LRWAFNQHVISDPCSPDPCQNDGLCSDGTCTCTERYKGKHCQTQKIQVPECPSGFQLGNSKKSCYLATGPGKNFGAAESWCRSQGGYLVTVNGKAENSYLQTLMQQRGFAWCWTGLHDQNGEGNFKWIGLQANAGYRNFAHGEPNNSDGSEDCVYIDRDRGTWNDNPCNITPPTICEAKTVLVWK